MQAITTIDNPPASDLALSVIIPACNEPGLVDTLQSLTACNLPEMPVEVIVVVNHSENATSEVASANESSLKQVQSLADRLNQKGFAIHPIYFPDLPAKHAGVGLARKLGMDLAAARQHGASAENGVLASLDADCLVDKNYLLALKRAFEQDPRLSGASIRFEHRLNELSSQSQREAAIAYELHLRLYVNGLRLAGYPYAYHTIGSCMAVRTADYRKLGGMNRRQAGEDFYFLEKFMLQGDYRNINDTCVYPSARISNRAPFGTGVTIREWSADPSIVLTYPLEIYRDIAKLTERFDELYDTPEQHVKEMLFDLPPPLANYLDMQNFTMAIAEANANSASIENFRKRLLRWLRPFRVMKYANFARNEYGAVPVLDTAIALLQQTGKENSAKSGSGAVLQQYRSLDAHND